MTKSELKNDLLEFLTECQLKKRQSKKHPEYTKRVELTEKFDINDKLVRDALNSLYHEGKISAHKTLNDISIGVVGL